MLAGFLGLCAHPAGFLGLCAMPSNTNLTFLQTLHESLVRVHVRLSRRTRTKFFNNISAKKFGPCVKSARFLGLCAAPSHTNLTFLRPVQKSLVRVFSCALGCRKVWSVCEVSAVLNRFL